MQGPNVRRALFMNQAYAGQATVTMADPHQKTVIYINCFTLLKYFLQAIFPGDLVEQGVIQGKSNPL